MAGRDKHTGRQMHTLSTLCSKQNTFGDTEIRCWPFQYLMSPMLCNVVMMSSGLIADISLVVRAYCHV